MKNKARKLFPVSFKAATLNIDTSAGIIKDIVIVNKGLDKVGDNIDDVFLRQIADQGNAQSMGVKSRFGHPNMCDTALGTFIGRYKNFRVTSTGVIADLHMDTVAKNSPKGGNLYDYVLSMASKNDDMFGNSIHFMEDLPFIREEDDGKGGKQNVSYIRSRALLASDLVDTPAATESLFKSFNEKSFAELATEFLDGNPELFELLEDDENILPEFLNRYKQYLKMKKTKSSKSTWEKIQEALRLKTKDEKSIEVSTTDGMLNVSDDDNDGKPGPGDTVSDADGKATPNKTYTMTDGTKFTTNADSKIETVEPASAAPAATTAPTEEEKKDAEIVALKKEAVEKDKKITELEKKQKEVAAQLKEYDDQMPAVLKEIETMKSRLAKTESEEEVEDGETEFDSEKQSGTGKKKNRVAQAHAQREEAEKENDDDDEVDARSSTKRRRVRR